MHAQTFVWTERAHGECAMVLRGETGGRDNICGILWKNMNDMLILRFRFIFTFILNDGKLGICEIE
jgi:hypothetical protein